MKLMFVLILITVESAAQVTPITQARKLRSGTIVTVGGRVTASEEFGDLTFIQDATGGIPVYSNTVAQQAERGDSIIVTGKIAKFNGLIELLPDSVRKIEGLHKTTAPRDVELNELEDHEGELVRVSGMALKPPEHFFYPQRSGMMVKGTDTLYYWVDGDTDIPGYSIPATPVTITGLVGRFKDHLQLLPRTFEDIPGVRVSPLIRNDNTLAIMNWNLEFFGASRRFYGSEFGPPDEALQIENAARLLNAIQADVIALQEVSNDDAFRELLKLLSGYEGRCSSRYSYSFDTSDDFPPQKLCFIYRSHTVKLVREKILFRKLYDDALSSQSRLLAAAPGGAAAVFSSGRLPYQLEVDVTNNGVTKRLSFINIHGKSGATFDDHARRSFDARLLKDTLDQYYSGRNFMVLGDLNDDLDVSIAAGRDSPYIPFVNDNRYQCVSKKLSDDGWHSTISYDDVIDHQIVSSSMADSYVIGSAKIVNPFTLVERYGETTSDHLPVISEFDFRSFVTEATDPLEVVFPNPTTGVFVIAYPGSFEYQLVNSLGVNVAMGSGFMQTECDMLLNHPPGLYTLIISEKIFRLIKQ
jgi:endonuclease/exonuclease/phosphatase family metal-dependent hydrolase